MSHIPYEKWLHYVNGELNEKVRERYDDHLYQCDQCLQLYIDAIEQVEKPIPQRTTESMFTDEIMLKINKQKTMEESKADVIKDRSFYQKAVFHYVVAAAMTIILMSSGVFSNLLHVVGDFEELNKDDSSILLEFVDKSNSIIDKVQR